MTIPLREYARLTTAEVVETSLTLASISSADFDELCQLEAERQEGLPPLVRMEGRNTLSLRNYVGVLELKSGTRIEILPKTCEGTDASAIQRERTMLFRMLRAALGVSPREAMEADIQKFPAPISEWVIRHFLLELHQLFKHGLRFDYQRKLEERPYLRGSLDVRRQMVQPPHRLHLFNVRHDVFSPDRPEHRLLRRALDKCIASTQDEENIRLASPLRTLFAPIPPSSQPQPDFRQWSTGRHMAHYQPVRPWCELVLGDEMPFALAGGWRGLSMLFPMEKLFEKYVASCLSRQLPSEANLFEQIRGRSLCHLGEQPLFSLQPDLLLEYQGTHYILDTKWKLLSKNASDKYGIHQGDLYQLFAYGHAYIGGKGDMALIYPQHEHFPNVDVPFLFIGGLRLWLIGWDLQNDCPSCPQASPFSELLRQA